MADAPKLLDSDKLYQAYPKLNKAIDNSNEALKTANTSKSTADTALTNSKNTQTQLDTIVINGDSSVEAAQARVNIAGKTFSTLNQRIDNVDNAVDVNTFSGATITDKFNAAINFLAISDKMIRVPKGKYDIAGNALTNFDPSRFIFEEGATIKDSNSGEYFRPLLPGVDPYYFFSPYQSKYNNVLRTKDPTVVCYGDSNTRFYYGDTTTDGEIQLAYSTVAEVLSLQYSNISGAKFINKGFPSRTAEEGDSDYDNQVTPLSPHVVVLGYGTNNVKDPAKTLDSYLTSMDSMIKKILSFGALPIVLTIPDFSDVYSSLGTGGRYRVRVWNTHLVELTKKRNVPIIDVYTMFNSFRTNQSGVWYNEATNWRHFSAYAQQLIATELCNILSERSIFPGVRTEGFSITGKDSRLYSVSATGVTSADYNMLSTKGGYRFSTLNLSSANNGLVSFRTQGDAVTLSFYPRDNAGIATITVKSYDGTVIDTATFDTYGTVNGGLFMPVKKWTYKGLSLFSETIIEVKPSGSKNAASSGSDIYLNGISAMRFLQPK